MKKHLKEKVLYILEKNFYSRNSDDILVSEIWKIYYFDKLIYRMGIGYCMPLNNLKDIPNQADIGRIRRQIQNIEHKFLPTDPAVLKARRILEQKWYQESFNSFNNI